MSWAFPKGRTATANQGDCTWAEQSPVDIVPQGWGNLTRKSLLEQFKYFSVKNPPDIFLSYIIWIHLIFEDLNFYASLRGWHNLSRTTVKPQPFLSYRKIPRISPGAYIFQRPFLRGLFLERLTFGGAYLRREICVSIVGSKFTVFTLFYFVFEGNFPSTSPRGPLYLEGRFNGGVFALPVWGAYI